jgi:hypothetical protein
VKLPVKLPVKLRDTPGVTLTTPGQVGIGMKGLSQILWRAFMLFDLTPK